MRGLLHHLKRPEAAAATWGAGLEAGRGRGGPRSRPAPPLPGLCAPRLVPAPSVCLVHLCLPRRARALRRALDQGPGVESASRWRLQHGVCGARPDRRPRLPRIVRGRLALPTQCPPSSHLPCLPRCPSTPFIPVFPGFPRPVELWLPQPMSSCPPPRLMSCPVWCPQISFCPASFSSLVFSSSSGPVPPMSSTTPCFLPQPGSPCPNPISPPQLGVSS